MRYKNLLFYSIIILIVAGGVFLRFWFLNTIPPGVHYDEAYNGMNALWANENHNWKIFYPENTGREGLHINVIAFFISLFGNNNLGLRFASAMWGSLTIIGFYFLLRELKFSRLSIAVGTFMMATSFWHLVFSRTAYRAIMVPMVLVWMFYFLWKAVNSLQHHPPLSKSIIYLILSGLFLGLGFHTYISFRIAPVIIAILLLAVILTGKDAVKNYWKYGAAFLLAILIAALPIFVYFSDHIKDFVSRSEAVSIFNAPNMTLWQAFWKSLGKHVWAFFVMGDKNPRHNFNSQPLLPAAWSVLFAIGFFISLKEIWKTIINVISRRKDALQCVATRWFYVSVLAQSMFWTMLAPGIMSIEGIPHSLRIIGVIPAVFILILLPFEYILNFYEEIKNTPGLEKRLWQKNGSVTIFFGIVFMVIFGGLSQMYIYFNSWAKDVATLGAYERKLYNLGFLIRDLSPHQNNYIITAFNTSVTPDHKQSSLKTAEYIGYPNSQKYIFWKPMDGVKQISCDDPQLVFLESDQWLRDQYKNSCPGLQQKRYLYDNGKYIFWVMSNNP